VLYDPVANAWFRFCSSSANVPAGRPWPSDRRGASGPCGVLQQQRGPSGLPGVRGADADRALGGRGQRQPRGSVGHPEGPGRRAGGARGRAAQELRPGSHRTALPDEERLAGVPAVQRRGLPVGHPRGDVPVRRRVGGGRRAQQGRQTESW